MKENRNNRKWSNLYLVRHGESTCNEVNRFAGSIDAPLTPLGEAQARMAARHWDGPPPEIVFTSPLRRARRTANILFPDAGDGPIRQLMDERLSERHFGDFTLKNKAFIQRETGLRRYEEALYGEEAIMPAGESFGRFYQRILAFLKEVLHPLLVAGRRVLVVAHKYVIELLCRMILRLPVGNGHDLRLPNGKILAGAELRTYIGRELRVSNLLQEWIVLRHALILSGSAVAGILLSRLQLLPAIPPLLPLALLALATGISLARVDLRNLRQGSLAPGSLLLRFVLLPLVVAGFSASGQGAAALFFLALLLAAPSAITGITISRCMGGMVAPTVQTLLFSTVSGTAMMLPFLSWSGSELLVPAVRLLAVSVIGLGIPILAVGYLRRRFPIDTADFGERNGAAAVLLLALFVLVSFTGIRFESAWPAGAWALLFALGLRLLALGFVRRGSLFAVDYYVSMSYPNIFFVIVLAAIMGWQEIAAMATWFLLPMFALAPFDEWLCRKYLAPGEDARLLTFLGITPPASGGGERGGGAGADLPALGSAVARKAHPWPPAGPERQGTDQCRSGRVPCCRISGA